MSVLDALLPGMAPLVRLAPEAVLVVGALVPLVWGRLMPGDARARGAVVIGASALLTSSLLALGDLLHTQNARDPFGALAGGQLIVDGYACAFRALLAWVAACTLITLLPRIGDSARSFRSTPRQVSLFALAVLGMNVLTMASGLVVAWLGAEIVAVAGIGLIALGVRDRDAISAALKLAVVSAVASAAVVYGVTVFYGLTRSLSFQGVGASLAAQTASGGQVPEAAYLGAILVFLGMAAKAGVLPYRGAHGHAFRAAPVPVAGFLAVGPPAATLALFVRFFGTALDASGPDPSLAHAPWAVTVGLVGLACAVSASLSALREECLAGALADLALATQGAALVSIAVFGADGASAALALLVAGSPALAAAFAVASGLVADAGERGERGVGLTAGLGRRSPWAAAALVVCLLSLAGVPPFIGFAARLGALVALLRQPAPFTDGYLFAAVVLGGVSLAGLAVALRFVQRLYFAPADLEDNATIRVSHAAALAALLLPALAAAAYAGAFEDLLARATVGVSTAHDVDATPRP